MGKNKNTDKSGIKNTGSKKRAAGSKKSSSSTASKKNGRHSFSDKELQKIKKNILAEKQRIIEDVMGLKGDSVNKSLKDVSGDLSGYSFHMADMATDLYDREFALGLAEGERELLYALDDALKKIQDGTYGLCETCGEKIPKGRLKVVPQARYCLKHQEEVEKNAGR
jgi:DnaK suppressor protein